MKSRTFVVAGVLLVLSLALALSGCQVATPQPEQAPAPEAQEAAEPGAEGAAEPEAAMGTAYKIGFAPGVTGGGAFLGEPERNVAEIIAARLEEAGGIVGSDGVKHPVEILIGDTETNPDVAVSVARRYVEEDEVVAVIGGSVTPISLAIAEVAEEAEVPYISMASSLAIITDPETGGMRPWVFKVAQSNGDVAVWQVKRIETLGATSVCYLHENTGYGTDCFNSSSAALEAAGFETAYEDSFERTDTEFPRLALRWPPSPCAKPCPTSPSSTGTACARKTSSPPPGVRPRAWRCPAARSSSPRKSPPMIPKSRCLWSSTRPTPSTPASR
jgi:hypothetical protein